MTDPVATRRVLVVEDDDGIADAITGSLEDEGYEVVRAANGREALERLRDGPLPCVILLDLMMPVMNGQEFRAQQRQEPDLDAIPVVVITGDGHAATKAAQLSANGWLLKPIALDDLLATVATYC